MDKNKKLKQNLFYNSIGNFAFLALQWLTTILVVQLSGYKDAGILSLSMSFANSLYAFSSFGMRNFQSSDINYNYDNYTYIKSRLLTCIIGYSLFFIVILIMHYSLYVKLCILIYLLYKSVEAFDDVYYGALQREWTMKEIGLSYIFHGVSSFLSFIIGLLYFKNILVSFLIMTITSIIITIFYDKKAFDSLQIKPNKTRSLKDLILVCIPLVTYAVLFNNIQVYPRYLLEKITTQEILGIYSSIASPVLLIQVVAGYIFYPLLNIFTEYATNNKNKEYKKLVNRVYFLIIILGTIGTIYIYFLGDFSLKILFGDYILKYSQLLYSTLLMALLMALMTFNNMLLIISRKFYHLIKQNLISLILSVFLSNILIVKYKIYGINYTLIISLAVGILSTIYQCINYNKKESVNMKSIKKSLISFGVKHKNVILRFFPNSLIEKIERFANSGSYDFKRTESVDKRLENGINLVGYLKGQHGLGQGGRLLVHSLNTTNIKFSAIAVNQGTSNKNNDTEFDDILTNDFKYNINLIHVQPYTSFEIGLSQIEGTKNLKGRYNIGYWVYETEDIPKKWSETFKYVNEIWTPSTFATEAFKKISPVPVYTVPYGLKIEKDEKLTRKDFGIPKDKFAYLIMYDPSSLAERKNPKATIDAYLKAFKNNNDVCLVVVLNKATEEQIATLKSQLKGVKNLTLINKTLPKPELYALISLCDVYVSLHRSEGFGLIMAEAMFLGTVCVATNYSGNLEFMNKDNSSLVEYKMIEVDTSTQMVYEKGNKWADADVEDASKYMKKLFEDKKYYKKLQKNAIEYVNKYLTPEYCGKLIKKRYDEIIKKYGDKNGTKNSK